LVDRVSRSLVSSLLQGWLTAGRSLVKAVRAQLTQLVPQLQLTPEELNAGLHAACHNCLQQDPEEMFAAIVHNHIKPGDIPEPESIEQALAQLDEILGQPQEDEENSTGDVSSPMIEALDAAARSLRKEWEHKLVELIHGLMDDPNFRIVGTEEAGLQITTMFEELVEQQQGELEEVTNTAEQAYLAIEELLTGLEKGSWWPGRKSRLAEELRHALELYPKARYQILVLEALLDVYQKEHWPSLAGAGTSCRTIVLAWRTPSPRCYARSSHRTWKPWMSGCKKLSAVNSSPWQRSAKPPWTLSGPLQPCSGRRPRVSYRPC
jgi:hypothetical protein